MPYSEADKRDIALQNANNAAAAIIAGIVQSSGVVVSGNVDLSTVLTNFDKVRDHIFNGTRGVTATAVAAAPATASAPAAAASAASGFTGADSDILSSIPSAKDPSKPRFKGPQGKYVGKTLLEILAMDGGRDYLKFCVDNSKDAVGPAISAFLARHPA